eukprot:TRINITY_DN4840_c0_g1_i1.p1 TRINITY_DN4840_c0_g1~~TRINITY_DN4840_c0_g1_i1.p1  ORF type:complete len:282 (+),score=22.67 TRINITY_DN4840_c0_g1_i1:497-1342(+)
MASSALASNHFRTTVLPAFTPQLKFTGSQVSNCCLDSFSGLHDRCYVKTRRSTFMPHFRGKSLLPRCSMDSAFGGQEEDASNSPVFPRINVRDPYKRLGISREASEEEIQAARNFLLNKYAGHKASINAIESAYDKILLQSFRAKWMPKIDLKGKWRNVRESKLMKGISSRFTTPSTKVIFKTTALYIALGIWSFLNPTEDGPVYQVAISFAANIYFIYSRMRRLMKAFFYGVLTFLFSWVLSSFLMATLLPPLVGGLRSLEASTSIVSYTFLWIASTYFK